MYAMTILLNLQEDKYKSQIDICHLFATFGEKNTVVRLYQWNFISNETLPDLSNNVYITLNYP